MHVFLCGAQIECDIAVDTTFEPPDLALLEKKGPKAKGLAAFKTAAAAVLATKNAQAATLAAEQALQAADAAAAATAAASAVKSAPMMTMPPPVSAKLGESGRSLGSEGSAQQKGSLRNSGSVSGSGFGGGSSIGSNIGGGDGTMPMAAGNAVAHAARPGDVRLGAMGLPLSEKDMTPLEIDAAEKAEVSTAKLLRFDHAAQPSMRARVLMSLPVTNCSGTLLQIAEELEEELAELNARAELDALEEVQAYADDDGEPGSLLDP